jgi:hypothetical protein
MRINYVLVDYENVPVKSLVLLEGEHFRVRVFLGPKNTKLPVELVVAMQRLGNQAEYTTLEASGTNALDFHIAYYLGILSATDPTAFFHIISKDSGFDPLIQYLKKKSIFACRSTSIEDMPCFSKKEASEVKILTNGQPAKKIKATSLPVTPAPELDKTFKIVHDDLVKRKTGKPRTIKTLKSTMQARWGKEVSSSIIDAIFNKLVKTGYVKVNGEKVTYAPPES